MRAQWRTDPSIFVIAGVPQACDYSFSTNKIHFGAVQTLMAPLILQTFEWLAVPVQLFSYPNNQLNLHKNSGNKLP